MSERTRGGLYLPDADDVARLREPTKAPPEAPLDAAGVSFAVRRASPYFATDPSGHSVLEDGFVIVAAQRIATVASIVPVLEQVARSGLPVAIAAAGFADEVVDFLVVNKLRGVLLQCVAVEANAETLGAIATYVGVTPGAEMPQTTDGLPRVLRVVAASTAIVIAR
jgi:hypothetical protein